MYHYSHLEDYIITLYTKIGIQRIEHVTMKNVASGLDITVYTFEGSSEGVYAAGRQYIFLNRDLSLQEQWQEFGHELCHILRHAGHQGRMAQSFVEYQEWQADNFALHVCIPTFMLVEMELSRNRKRALWEIQESFNVTYDFAEKRLEQFTQKHAYAMLS